MARSPRQPNSCMTKMADAAWPYPRLCPAAVSSPARRCGRTLLCTGARVNSYSRIKEAVILPYVEIGRGVFTSAKSWSTVASAFPTSWLSAKTQCWTRSRFRRSDKGVCLITQAMIDRLRVKETRPGNKRPLSVLAVASEDLSADQDRRAGGRRAGALPLALAAPRISCRDNTGARLSRRAGGAARLAPRMCSLISPDLFGGQASVLCAARQVALDIMAIAAPHLYDRPGNPYQRPDGLDWPDNAQRFAAAGRDGRQYRARCDQGLQALPLFMPMTGKLA
jgi:hypothetical protein